MAAIRKFLFDTDFDDSSEAALKRALAPKVVEEPVVEEPPPPPPPMFSEEQVEAVRQQAYEIGVAAGRSEAEETHAHQLGVALESIAASLRGIGDAQIQQAEANHRDAVRIALAVAERVLPNLAARQAMDEIAALFSECMAFLLEEPRITVKVAESLLDEARQSLQPIAEAAGFEGRIMILADPSVVAGDCRIEWPQGGAERTMGRLWQDIKTVLERGLGADPIPSAEELETV